MLDVPFHSDAASVCIQLVIRVTRPGSSPPSRRVAWQVHGSMDPIVAWLKPTEQESGLRNPMGRHLKVRIELPMSPIDDSKEVAVRNSDLLNPNRVLGSYSKWPPILLVLIEQTDLAVCSWVRVM